jgi:hypothetical protein
MALLPPWHIHKHMTSAQGRGLFRTICGHSLPPPSRGEHQSILGISAFVFGFTVMGAYVVVYVINPALKPGG